MGMVGSSQGLRGMGREANHPPSSSATQTQITFFIGVAYFNNILSAASIQICICRIREREDMTTMMSKPDFQNPLQFINDVVVWICPVCFEYVLCKNYL